jgi:exosome complex component RRP40
MDPELECFDAETGKASGFGELKGGMVFSVSLGLARRLLGDGKKLRQVAKRAGEEWEGGNGAEVLEELGKSVAFECAVGRNGKVWVDSEDVKTTLMVGRCITASENLTGEEVREMVRMEMKKSQG